MDTSPEYVLMCQKATEITANHQWEDGDCAYWSPRGFYTLTFHHPELSLDEQGEGCLWLPAQDHLQEMLEWSKKGRFGVLLIDAFYTFAKSYNSVPFGDETMTWEQLWLAFVMHEKYQKKWNGMDWIKDS